MDNPEIILSEYWHIIRKRKLTIVFVFALVMAATVVFTKLQTPIYEASLDIKIDRQQLAAGYLANQALILSPGTLEFDTEIQIITNLPLMRKVVEKMEALPTDPEEREKQITALALGYKERVGVEQIGDTNILRIRVSSSDPEKAALMATAIADVYIVENVENRKRRSKAVMQYIEAQLVTIQENLSEKESILQTFQQNEKVFDVTLDVKNILDRLTSEGTFEFETEMLKIDADLDKLKSVIAEHKNNEIFKMVSPEAIEDNFIFTGLKRRLLELEFERFLLLIDYTDKHPSVMAQDQVINDVKDKIVAMLKGFSKEPITPNVEVDLSIMIKKLFLENRRDVLFRIVNQFYEEEGALSSNQLKYVQFKRDIERLIEQHNTMVKQQDEVNLNLAKVMDDVITIVSPAIVPSRPIKPNAKVNYMVSSALGLLLGLMICFIKENIDSSVSTISDVEEELKLSMLGVIPHMKKNDVLIGKEEDYGGIDKKLLYQKLRLVTIMDPKSWPAESFKMLRTNLVQIMKKNDLKSLLFTSSDKQEGKSTIVTNMALSMAQLGKKTVLVDFNMRRPTSYKIFGLDRAPGLSDILMGNIPWREAINSSVDILTGGLSVDHLLNMPGIDNLQIITCGRPVDNASELIDSNAYDQLLLELKQHFDVIIIDSSPVMTAPDAITLSNKVDGVVMVYKVGHTAKDVFSRAKLNLTKANANILGIVLNDIKTEAQVGFSAYYYRYYSESGEKKKKSVMDKWKGQLERKNKEEVC